MLGKKKVLMIGQEGVVLFGHNPKGGIEREASISWELPDFDAKLVEALEKKNSKRSILLLYDGSDTSFRKETNIPRLNSFDRKKYIVRKLNQVFANYPIKSFIETTGKVEKGDKPPIEYLFVAVTDVEKIERVISCIFESGVIVSGLGLLPIESEKLIDTLDLKIFGKENKSKWVVYAGQHECGGLRQVIIKDGKMAFTRITPTSDAGIQGEGWANEFIEEFKATQTYLTRLNFRPGETLSVIVSCGENEKKFFESKGFAPGDRFACITAEEGLKHIGFKKNTVGNINFSDSVYAAWNSKKSSLKLPISLPSIDNIKWPRIVVSVLSIAVLLAIFGLAYFNNKFFEEITGVEEQTDKQKIQERMLSKEYDEGSKVFSQFSVPLDVVKGTIAVDKFLNDNVFKLTQTLNVLRAVFPRDIKLLNMSVNYIPPKEQDSGNSRSRSSSRGRGNPNEVDPETTRRMEVKFDFVLVKKMSLEEKVVRAENLMVFLQGKLPGYEIVLNKQFGNISREAGFSGSSKEDVDSKKNEGREEFASVTIRGPAL